MKKIYIIRIIFLLIIILAIIGYYLYNFYQPLYINTKKMKEISISTIRSDLESKTINIQDKQTIQDIFKSIDKTLLYNKHIPGYLLKCSGDTYEIKVNNQYTILTNEYTPSSTQDVCGVLIRNNHRIMVSLPLEFVLKIQNTIDAKSINEINLSIIDGTNNQ